MNRRCAGVVFCGIAALLFERSLGVMLTCQAIALTVVNIISLIVGVGYLVWAEVEKEK